MQCFKRCLINAPYSYNKTSLLPYSNYPGLRAKIPFILFITCCICTSAFSDLYLNKPMSIWTYSLFSSSHLISTQLFCCMHQCGLSFTLHSICQVLTHSYILSTSPKHSLHPPPYSQSTWFDIISKWKYCMTCRKI